MTVAASLSELHPAQFAIAVALASLLAMAIFAHASRHGSRHPTAWGVLTFLFAGVVVPAYVIHYWATHRRA